MMLVSVCCVCIVERFIFVLWWIGVSCCGCFWCVLNRV